MSSQPARGPSSHALARSFRRQRLVIAVVAVALVGIGIGVPLAQHLSRSAVDSGPARPAAFQIMYLYGTSTTGGLQQWEVLTVQRPFDASDLYYGLSSGAAEPGPGAVAQSGSAFGKDLLYSVDRNGPHAVSGRQPGSPGTDQDLITQLPEMHARNEVADTGQRQSYAGRSCEVWRFAGPPTGAVAVLKGSDHDDLCIDQDGLVLSEAWTYRGNVVEKRVAQRVSIGAVPSPFTAAQWTAAGNNDTLIGRGVPVAHDEPGAHTFVPAPPVPNGYTAAGQEGFVEPNPENPQSLLASSLVWAFSHGADLITVEAGISPVLPWSQDDTRSGSMQLTGLGAARSEIRSDGSEIEVGFSGNRWLRIRGTVPLAGLLTYADQLTAPTS